MERLLFYLIAASLIGFGLLTVTSRRILRAAVYLFFVLAGVAALYFLMGYNFLAAVQLVVYAGGVMVLIIFAILLTHGIDHRLRLAPVGQMLMAIALSLAGIGVSLFAIYSYDFPKTLREPEVAMSTLGEQLLSLGKNGYLLPFEVISILLLAAMVGAIVIAKGRKNKKQAGEG